MGLISSFIKAFIILTLYLTFIGYWLVKGLKDDIDKNWTSYRSNPFIMPFAGLVGRDSVGNIKGVLWTTFKKYFLYLLFINQNDIIY